MKNKVSNDEQLNFSIPRIIVGISQNKNMQKQPGHLKAMNIVSNPM
jgi:hypothetical protein